MKERGIERERHRERERERGTEREGERESEREKIEEEKVAYLKLLHKRMRRKKDTKLSPSILSHKILRI